MTQRLPAQYLLHKKLGNGPEQINAEEQSQRGSKRCWGKIKETDKDWKQDQIYGVLFNRAVQLHYPCQDINCTSDVERRAITLVFLLLCSDWWNGVWQEVLWLFCCSLLFTVIHALSVISPLLSQLSVSFFYYHLLLFFCLDSASLLTVLLCWANAIQRANATEWEMFHHSPPRFSSMLEQLSFGFSELLLSHTPTLHSQTSFQRFMGLSEMYKWGDYLPSVLLCLLSFGKCCTLTPSVVPPL